MKPMEQKRLSNSGIYIGISWKLQIIFTLLFTVVFGIAYLWFYQFATQMAKDDLRRNLAAIASTTANGIDGDSHQALYESNIPSGGRPIDDQRYIKIVSWLKLVKESQGKISIEGKDVYRVLLYTYVPTKQKGVIEFVGSSSALNDSPGGAKFRDSYTTKPVKDHPNFMVGGLSDVTVNIDFAIQDAWGQWVSAFAPIHNSEGEIVGAVGVDMQDTTVKALQDRIRNAVIPAFLLTYAILFVSVWWVSYQISRPLRTLTYAVERVAEGDYSKGLIAQPNVSIRDETTTLSRVFHQMVDKIAMREFSLKQQVEGLRIEIDQARRNKQVNEIVESDFFHDLQVKARHMRKHIKQSE
jgi:methyl-accepting chemotaxis protein